MSHAADHYKSEKIMLLSDITGHRLMFYCTSPNVTAPCILGTIGLSLFFPDPMAVTSYLKSRQLLRLTFCYHPSYAGIVRDNSKIVCQYLANTRC